MIFQSFRMAFSSILSSKMRSFLTMLGIIIGVVAVVVLISLVNGATDSVTSEIEGLGSNLLSVTIRNSRYHQLQVEDLEAMSQNLPSVYAIAPDLTRQATARNGSRTFQASIQGTTPEFLIIGNLRLLYGRFLKSPDLVDHSAVAVIGVEVADELFGQREAVGESILVNGRRLLVIGVLEEGTTAFGGPDQRIIIPHTLAQRLFSQKHVTSFAATAVSSDLVNEAEQEIISVLLRLYRQDSQAFSILNQSSILGVMDSVMSTLSLLLGGIAGISLLVGGIGIMNIMLVSVSERTREIGIRKAIGAGRYRILLQFLIESMVISVIGGLIGLLLSGGLLSLASALSGISFRMTADVITLALTFSIVVGVVFGLYPASKASKLHPIQALRVE